MFPDYLNKFKRIPGIYKPRIDSTAFFILAVILRVLFYNISWYSFFAILISLHQFGLLFLSIGKIMPVRYMFGALMCLQMLVGPTLAYNGLDQLQYEYYKMKIPEAEYFLYVIPAVVAFIIGLHFNAKNADGEFINQEAIKKSISSNTDLPYVFIIIGFLSSLVTGFFSSDLALVFYLLSNLKFIGVFILLFSGTQLKIIPLIIVYGSIIASSLNDAMFHDLLTWLIFLLAAIALKYRPSNPVKLGGAIAFILLAVTIQQLKGTYRNALSEKNESAGLETLTKAYEEGQSNNSLFNFNSLASSNVRINQGFIITNIMKTVPAKVPYSYGEEMGQILQAAIFPRIFAPNKLTAGNREIFMKYTNMPLRRGTSMGLSSVGDAYINFGLIGGSIFMFLLGLLYNTILKAFKKHSLKYPILILFTTVVFYYPIRPDCELQTILGHVVKSCFLIFIMFSVWKKEFFYSSKKRVTSLDTIN